MPEPGGENSLCATCEGRAIGAGYYGDRIINGSPVLFEPIRLYQRDAK